MDGPPLAYFEVTDGDQVVRRAYRTLRASTRESLDDNIDRLRVELDRSGRMAMIFWRQRPGSEPYARLITSPPLSNEFWTSIGWDQSGTGYSPP